MTLSILLILTAYLLGSMPVGLILGRCFGVDVRRSGSANIGATNVSRILGKKIGIATLIGDAFKGALPMMLATWLPAGQKNVELTVLICGAAAFSGHLFPVYLRFKGGKGVATALGIFLFLQPIAVLIVALVFFGLVIIWRYVSVGSLAASALLPVILILFNREDQQIILATGIALMIWIKHRSNIGRLLRGEESKY